MDNVNLKKLSKELNLAISTVSRALSDKYDISQKTKDRVRALAKELGYQPNPHGSSLRQRKSQTIAVIIPEIENNFFSQVLNGVESVAEKKGYHVLIHLTHEDYQREKEYLQSLNNGRVDGLMLSISNTTTDFEHIKAYEDAVIPMILFDRVCPAVHVPAVTTNDAEISFKATEQLIKRGCKHIAFLSMSSQLSITSGRAEGYSKAMSKYKMGRKTIVECTADDNQNLEIIGQLIKQYHPDGIFTGVEKFAINTYQACEVLGINIPDELKLVSFSNSSASSIFNPPLTAIVQPAFEMGKQSAEILFKLIEKKPLFPNEKAMVLPSIIIERASSVT